MRHPIQWIATLLLLALGPLAPQAAPPPVAGTQGAIRIPIEMPADGVATIALYSPSDQLVRILAQAVRLPKGSHLVLWDGMDLWGKPLPEGTALTCKLIHGPGLRAFYEFDLGRGDTEPDHPGWLTHPTGEGPAMRTGGWLGDHTGPGAAAAIGDKVFFGSRTVEHGHPLIACDLEGRKLWGGRVAGWDGPDQLIAAGDRLLARIRNTVWAIRPDTYAATRLIDTQKRSILCMGANSERILLLLRNPEASVSPFRFAVRHSDIAFQHTLPLMQGEDAPSHQIGAAKRYSSVFLGDGGHFQAGIAPVLRNGVGHVVLPLATPRTVKTLVLGRPTGAETVEVLRLKPGLTYDPARHSPLRNATPGTELEDGLDGLDMGDLDPNWEVLARVDFPQHVRFLALPDSPPLSALQLRLVPPSGKAASPRQFLGLCRLLDRPVEAVASHPTLTLGTGATAVSPQPPEGWHLRMAEPVTSESPAVLVADYGTPISCDGVFFLNNTSRHFTIEAYTGSGQPTQDPDPAAWAQAAEVKVGASGANGYPSASTFDRTTFVALSDTFTTRALRIRVLGAYGGGRVALVKQPDDPARVDCDVMLPIRLTDVRDRPPPHILQVRNPRDGSLLTETAGNFGNIAALALDADGQAYTLRGTTLARTVFSDGKAIHTDLNATDLRSVRSLTVACGEVVVGESGRVVFLDPQGKLLRTLGRAPYERGPWNRDRIGPASAVAVDRNGKAWIAEESYAPKRISRFAMDGTCEKEFFGPPQYGGGGWLDPDLRSFYYRGMQFALDWEHGTSRMLNLNDRLYTEETPALDASSFGYTQIGRPLYLEGRRYLVGDAGSQFGPGIVICLLDGPVWKPCVVAGPAKDSPFLFRKEVWKRHWMKQDLEGKLFLWTDRNDDGQYTLDEVSLFARDALPGNPFDGGYWGNWMGPDLTLWSGSARLAPSGFSPHGVPLYELNRIQPIRYSALAPFYDPSQQWGSRAAQGPSGTTVACADGSLSVCGQPYRVLPDGSLAGGPAPEGPSDYIPPVNGKRLHQVLHPAGIATTRSPVGEVVMHVGDAGIWSLSSVRDCVLLDQVFTGEDGAWSSDLPARRGIEVTRRKHDQETFFGHFVKALDGRYFAVAGKGFHALCRIEGLDDFRVATCPVTVTAESIGPNAALRERLRTQQDAARQRPKEKRWITAADVAAFKPKLLVDGIVEEWQGLKPMDQSDDPNGPAPTTWFGAAADAKGLYLAYRGCSHLGNQCDNADFVFKGGLAADFRYRRDGKARGNDPAPGDRRVVFGQVGGTWRAVLYDYLAPEATEDDRRVFESPVQTTPVDRVSVLPPEVVRLAFRPDELAERTDEERRYGPHAWGLEAFLSWEALGFDTHPKELRADFGVMLPDSGGVTVERRLTWAETGPQPISDLAAEAQIKPGEWGTLSIP